MSVEPTDQEALVKVTEALEILETQLASATATHAAAEPRLDAAQSVLAPLLAEQRQGTSTASTVGSMPLSRGGYVYSTAPRSDLAQRINRAQTEYEEARQAAVEAGAGVTTLKVKLGRLTAARRTILERLGAGGPLRGAPGAHQ